MLPLSQMLTIDKMMTDKAIMRTMNLFGVIVYTVEHPYIVKMLRDKDYWASLNARTKGWILYAIRPDDNHIHLTEEYLLPHLGITDSSTLPQLVILAAAPGMQIMQQNFPIDDTDVETAYHSIERIIGIVTQAASRIIPQERNGVNVYREVVAAVKSELATERWKQVSGEFMGLIRELIGFLS